MTGPGPFYLGVLAYLVILGGDFTVRPHCLRIWTGVSYNLQRQQQQNSLDSENASGG